MIVVPETDTVHRITVYYVSQVHHRKRVRHAHHLRLASLGTHIYWGTSRLSWSKHRPLLVLVLGIGVDGSS